MKAIIFGAGRQAEGVAWYLAKHSDFDEIGILSRSGGPIDEIIEFIGSEKLEKYVENVLDRDKTKKIMEKYDVGISTLPNRKTSYAAIETAIKANLNMVDILEEYHRRPDEYEKEDLNIPQGMSTKEYGESLHKKAVDNGVTIADGIGFAPGLTNITLGEGLREMDKGISAIARCGGIPEKKAAEKHPLKYMITWAFDHVLREYMIKTPAIKDGKKIELEALMEHETFIFDKFEKEEKLECAVTPGMPSFVYTRDELEETYEKTIRWPGHYNTIKELKECGMLDLDPIELKGKNVVPRDVLSEVLTPKLKPKKGDKDICVMWNTATGEKEGKKIQIDYYMWDEEDTVSGLTAMQRTTCFPAAITSEMLAKGEIGETGIVPPEDCIKGPLYKKMMSNLNNVDLKILKEKRTTEILD